MSAGQPTKGEADAGQPAQDPWIRLRDACAYAFTKADPDQPVPPVPKELKLWAECTTLSAGFGMLYAGAREWARVQSLPPVEFPAHAVNKAQAARLIAEENTVRVLRVQRAAVGGAGRFGALAALFLGVQLSSAHARDCADVWNIAYAGSATGTAVGLLLPYSPLQRVGNALLGGAAGGLLSYPIGMLQLHIEPWVAELLRAAEAEEKANAAATGDAKPAISWEVVDGQYKAVLPTAPADTTDNVISLLESGLSQDTRGADSGADGSRGKGGVMKSAGDALSRWFGRRPGPGAPGRPSSAEAEPDLGSETIDGPAAVPERYRR
mmetsp:Transcript_6490/g.16611  ORF Transcript_6490/g.16611 Transcript_6490/m.16611 type:complete len:323 (+) Transcript_6490:204-1172(+)